MVNKVSLQDKVRALIKVAKISAKATGDTDKYWEKQIKELEALLKKDDAEIKKFFDAKK